MVKIVGLSWDEQAENHIAGHQVTVGEVEEAIARSFYSRRSGAYLLLIGQTDEGRYLTIILDYEGGGYWYPVTARKTSRPERRLVKQQSATTGA